MIKDEISNKCAKNPPTNGRYTRKFENFKFRVVLTLNFSV
jgi:hypothetical protein